MKKLMLCACVVALSAGAAWAGPGGAGPMAVSGNTLYVVSGTELVSIDLSTYKVTARKDLTLIGREKAEEEARRRNEAYLTRWDENQDGKVTEEEAGRSWRWLKRQDKNGDGNITADEITIHRPMPRAAYGQATLMVHGGRLFMLRNGSVFVFDARSLDLKADVEVSTRSQGRKAHWGMPSTIKAEGRPGRTRRPKRKPVKKSTAHPEEQVVF